MTKRKNILFIALHVVAWIIFVGLCIEAGALVVNFIFSVYKPEVVPNLYQKLDLSAMYNRNKWVFFGMYGFVLFIAILKALLFYALITLMNKLDLAKPFNSLVSKQITDISYYTFSIGIVGIIAKNIGESLQHQGFESDTLSQFWTGSEAFILMSAVVYVIAAIFSKGVEIQNENDLTV